MSSTTNASADEHRADEDANADDASGGEPSVFRVGGVSYLQIPTDDPPRSASFYVSVFGWSVHGNPEHPNFADGSGHVIGSWVTSLPVARDAGVVPYIYVERVEDTIRQVTEAGGELVKAPFPEGNLTVATVRDPAGNVIGLWQQTAN